MQELYCRAVETSQIFDLKKWKGEEGRRGGGTWKEGCLFFINNVNLAMKKNQALTQVSFL